MAFNKRRNRAHVVLVADDRGLVTALEPASAPRPDRRPGFGSIAIRPIAVWPRPRLMNFRPAPDRGEQRHDR